VLCFFYLLYASVVSPVCVLVVLAGSEFLLLLYLLFKKKWMMELIFLCCLCICRSSAVCDFSGLCLFASNVRVVEEIGADHFSEALLALNWFFYTINVSVRLLFVIFLDRALICFKCVRVVEEIWAGHFVRIVLADSI
jgi:hypothetical protein